MSAFTVVPKGKGRYLAVRSWPGNEEDIENLFGDRVRKSEAPGFYDWELVTGSGYEVDPVCRGDWIVLTPSNVIQRYAQKDFEKTFTIMESIFNVPDPTGKKDEE